MSVLENGVDTIIYAGEISRDGYEQLTKVCEKSKSKKQNKKANVILYTYGGDPHAAFRIARALQHHYSDGVTLFIPHYCKSAGTLIAIGATELVISDMGELGPLDVQLAKSSEMFERSSGMDITQGMEALRSQALESFKHFAVEIKIGSKLSTKIATEVATEMTAGLFRPIFAQIDPARVGEIQRATLIAFRYGRILERKWRNVQAGGVAKLIAEYPSHSFVIDRKEARDIFKLVREPQSDEVKLLKDVDVIMRNLLDSQEVTCFLWNQEEPSHETQSPPPSNEPTNAEQEDHDENNIAGTENESQPYGSANTNGEPKATKRTPRSSSKRDTRKNENDEESPAVTPQDS